MLPKTKIMIEMETSVERLEDIPANKETKRKDTGEKG